jgi:2-hydroxychromene-2-carboxylate isomerase
MTLTVELFFSFRSPYSYLALPKTLKLVADYDAAVKLRPVYPLAVRVPGFFKKTNPQFLPYVALDSSRVAQRETFPTAFPVPTRSCRTWRHWRSPSISPTSIA